MMTAAETYAARIDAGRAQRARLHGASPPDDPWAGRVALPLALRCREALVVDASPGMGAEFTAAVAEAGIPNARFVHATWLEAVDLQGDVALTASVTYFVREIVPFIE